MEYKSPTDIFTFEVNWLNEIGGSTVSTSVWTLQTGITSVTETIETPSTKLKISGGTAGIVYQVQNRITTAVGESFEKEFKIRVRRQQVG